MKTIKLELTDREMTFMCFALGFYLGSRANHENMALSMSIVNKLDAAQREAEKKEKQP